ncbi:MAG: hypothetical protein LC687_05620 [Actinobacteria bacterium]|nr:hypothetical protein [Actinomycetota bacterium]MCA1807310.1 hypothetical protein [Actinomycetota bacterium]
MNNKFKFEPVIAMLVVRVVIYLIGMFFGIQIAPESTEALISALVGIFAVDAATTMNARGNVMPMARVEEKIQEGIDKGIDAQVDIKLQQELEKLPQSRKR